MEQTARNVTLFVTDEATIEMLRELAVAIEWAEAILGRSLTSREIVRWLRSETQTLEEE